MKLNTRVFELSNGKHRNLSELARAMGISISLVSRVRLGERPINQKFIVGAVKAFPDYRLDELFYVAPEETVQRTSRNEAIKLKTGGLSYAEIGRRLGVTRERARRRFKEGKSE